MVLFILSEIINLRNQEKTEEIKNLVLNELHALLTRKPKAAHTCYLRSLYPYPCSLNVLSKFVMPCIILKKTQFKKPKTSRKQKACMFNSFYALLI